MEVRCLTCGAFMSREAEDREHFRRETAKVVLAGFAANNMTGGLSSKDLTGDAVEWANLLIDELERTAKVK